MSGEVVTEAGAPYKPPPLSPSQEAAEFRVVGARGGEIVGGFVDGAEGASYTIMGRIGERGETPRIRVFIRDGTDVVIAARMLRVMADELEAQKSTSDDAFEGVDRA